jgi:hypothetical protein
MPMPPSKTLPVPCNQALIDHLNGDIADVEKEMQALEERMKMEADAIGLYTTLRDHAQDTTTIIDIVSGIAGVFTGPAKSVALLLGSNALKDLIGDPSKLSQQLGKLQGMYQVDETNYGKLAQKLKKLEAELQKEKDKCGAQPSAPVPK